MIIIFVLGILAMIMIMGLTFLTTATLEKKASINYNNLVKADFTAETALNRAIQLIKIYSVSPVADYSHIMSFDNPTKRLPTKKFPTPISLTQKEYDILTHDLDKMSTTTNGIEYYKYVKGDKSKPLTWIYLRDEVDGPIVSRMAFIVIPPQTPKSPEAYWIDNDGNGKKDLKSKLYHRFNLVGADTDYWDNFNNKIANSPLADSPVLFSEKDPDKIKLGGIPWLKNWKSKGGFPSILASKNQIMANLIDYSDSDSNATTDNEDAPTYVGLEKVPYINEVNILFPFIIYLTRYSSHNVNKMWHIYEVTINPKINIELINMYSRSNPEMTATVDMDWEFTVRTTKFSITSNKPGTKLKKSWEITIPSSTNTHFPGFYDRIPWHTWEPNYSMTEVHWMKRKDFEAETWDNVKFPVRFKDFKINKLTVKLESKEINPKTNKRDLYDFANIVTPSNIRKPSNNKILERFIPYLPRYFGRVIQFDAQINDPQQNLLESDWLNYSLNSYDFNDWVDFLGKHDTLGIKDNVDSKYFIFLYNFLHLNKNNNNNNCNPNNVTDLDRDMEINAQEPQEISTAYIRNAPMKSPWELGFIHRGEKWQTINLKKFNTAEGVKADGGGNGYSAGDANILNQVKMSDATETYGKININSENIGDLTKLFKGIYVGSLANSVNKSSGRKMNPDFPTSDEINSSKAEKLATKLKNIYDKKNPFKSRAEILSNLLGGKPNEFRKLLIGENASLGLKQVNDAEQEEIIGKFMDKATIILGNPSTLNIIAMGESIKDLGNVTVYDPKKKKKITGKKGVFDIGVDKILASQKIFAVIGSREDSETANKKVFYIQKFKYID